MTSDLATSVPNAEQPYDWRSALAAPASTLLLHIEGQLLRADTPEVAAHFARKTRDETFAKRTHTLVERADLEAARNLVEKNQFQFTRYPAVELPGELAWTENPFSERNWQWSLHQWAFVPTLVAGYERTGERRFARKLLELVASWARHNMVEPFPCEMAWHDHATALRLEMLLLTFESLRTIDILDVHELAMLLGLIRLHASVLANPSFYSEHTNHGFDQCIALFLVSAVVPELEASPEWRRLAHTRLLGETRFAFSGEGIHVENSPGYHESMLQNLLRTNTLVRGYTGAALPEVGQLMQGALRFLCHITRPDGLFPLVGDTEATPVMNNYSTFAKVSAFAELEYARSRGTAGQPPRESCVVFEKSGYAVFRDDWHPAETFEQTLHLLFKCGFLSHYHRHDDDLSIVLYALGEDWLVDSGLYAHNDQDLLRQYMRGAHAHNLPVPHKAKSLRDPRRLAVPSEIVHWQITPERAQVVGRTGMFAGYCLSRAVEYDRARTITLSDTVRRQSKGGPVEYDLVFHVPRNKSVRARDGSCVEVTSQGGHLMTLTLAGDRATRIVIGRGQQAQFPSVQSRTYGKREDTQSIVFAGLKAEQIQTQIRLSPAGEARAAHEPQESRA
jgi:hypothetical protein